jgi:hypothetical protein
MISRVATDRAIGDDASTVNRTTVAAKHATRRAVTADGAVLDYEAFAREAGAIAVKVIVTARVVTADGTVLDQGAAGDSASVTVTPIVCDAALINR